MRPAILASAATAALAAVCLAVDQPNQKPDPAREEFFETRVRPVLVKSCQPCHGEKQQLGGLRVDSLAALLKGNSGGPVIVSGDPEKSVLIQVVRYDGKVKMPPAGKLKPDEIAALTEWVRQGAYWPNAQVSAAAAAAARSGEFVISPEMRRFWSFRPVREPKLPEVKQAWWVASPLDRFTLARLESKGLRPGPIADRRTLLRRVYFDLIGLPPSAEAVEAFEADKSPDAWARVVDGLLASPRFGERWARYWLDVARYADTRGYVFVEDREYRHAYTYRDWVIRAYNEDMPVNEFLMKQLAADQLVSGEDRRDLAALGFLTLGRRFLNNIHDIIDDRIDVVTRGMLGLTANCARCHDHKYDPISTKDYYALYGVFASSTEPNPPLAISPPEITRPYEAYQTRRAEAEKERNELLLAQVQRLRGINEQDGSALSGPAKKVLQDLRPRALPDNNQTLILKPFFEPDAATRVDALKQQIAELDKSAPPAPEFAMALVDSPNPVNPRVFRRGNPSNPGDAVPRRFLTVLSRDEPRPFQQGSGRLELARAIADPSNPLTARVYVNRVWLRLFGNGLVRSPSDFGTRGEPPTHPELLDYLAARFTAEGWSHKRLLRSIVLSNTYKQAARDDETAARMDPENRLLWRANRRRLDLEAMRDSLLYVSGALDLKMGGPAVDLTSQPYTVRRSVYGYIERQNLPNFFRTFDFASPDTTSPQRYQTTVPQQALFMMNSPFVVEQARRLVAREEVAGAPDDQARIRALYRLLFARNPSGAEVSLGMAFLRQQASGPTTVALQQPAAGKLSPWEKYAQALLMTNEFVFVD